MEKIIRNIIKSLDGAHFTFEQAVELNGKIAGIIFSKVKEKTLMVKAVEFVGIHNDFSEAELEYWCYVIINHLQNNRKLQAVKDFYDFASVSLKDAKAVVDFIQSDLETRSGYYKYVPNPDPFDFMALRENLERLIQIDRQQKELNMLVGQSFWVETQEGKAVYQIVSVKPFEWKIKVVYGLGNWDVVYPEWGEEKWIDAKKEGAVINNSLTVGMFS